MATQAALRADHAPFDADGVIALRDLIASGWTYRQVHAQVDARRWQFAGRAVIAHNGTLSRAGRWSAGLANTGPGALLTSFTVLEAAGLQGWERDEVHILVGHGARVTRPAASAYRIHYVGDPASVRRRRLLPWHVTADAAALAASSFSNARPGAGVVAGCVQQGLARADELHAAVLRAPRCRHRRTLLAATPDIGQGADALSEIDFGALCRRYRLPAPVRQAVRVEAGGRRRYLDASWRRRDGQLVVVEIDGALHLAASRWYADQLRQNEITLGGAVVLRFPSVVLRAEPDLVAAQLRRALQLDDLPTPLDHRRKPLDDLPTPVAS